MGGVVLAVAEALAVEGEEVLLAAVFALHRRRQGTGAGLRERRRIAVRYSGGWGPRIQGHNVTSLWAGTYRVDPHYTAVLIHGQEKIMFIF